MISETEDTIAAIATPPGRSALGIVRISGKDCHTILAKVFLPKQGLEINAFRPILGRIQVGDEKWIDEALLTFFEKPHSYTKEDLIEISCHGNPYILDRVLDKVIRSGARLARPGEFTYRAFLNGRLDLVQAEAVQDLISADTAYQVELALSQLEGRLSARFRELGEKLIGLISLMEGNVDFTEEQHYDFISKESVLLQIRDLISIVKELLGTFERGQWIREGYRVALVGKPNVGKSSLFNALLEKDRAIVTSVPGTTRDYLQERITLGNYVVHLFDTAGIRETSEVVEKEGVRRSLQVTEKADLILFVVDGSEAMTQEDFDLWKGTAGKDKLIVCNKLDREGYFCVSIDELKGIAVSATEGTGIPELREALSLRVEKEVRYTSHDYLISSMRHRDILTRTLHRLEHAQEGALVGLSEELTLIDLHAARQDLGEITGHVTIEDIYDQIFTKFCIGK